LSIRVRLMRSLPSRFKVDIFVSPGSHQSEHAGNHRSAISCPSLKADHHAPVNKQLNDKERVAAALENPTLLNTLEQCLATADRRSTDVQ
jgi:hypothetical protein